MQKCQETAALEWLTVLITRASLANFKLYKFSSFKTLHLVVFSVILQLTVSVQHFLFKSIWLHRFSGRQTFYDQWKNSYSLELHTSRKRLLPADCSAVSFLDQIQWNSQLTVRLYLPVRLNSLLWHNLLLLHFLTPFFSCPPVFLSLLSPHTPFLISSLSYTMCQNLSYNALYIFWQKQVEQYTSPSQTCKRWDARRLSTKWKCNHLEITASVDLSFPTGWNFAVSELFSKVSVSKRLHLHRLAQGTGLRFFKNVNSSNFDKNTQGL